MNTKQLKYFLVVAQERQITSAAKRLYIAQPPLSYQLKQLEKEIGTKLFTRTAYGIELTEAGKIFRKYAEKIVSLSSNAQEAIKESEFGELGTIRLGLISSAGKIMPDQKLRALTKYYPQLKFEIIEDNTFGIIEKLNQDLIDLAVVRTPFNMRGLAKIELNTDRMTAVFDPHKFEMPDQVRVADLKGCPLILYRRFEAIFNATFAHQGIMPFYAIKCDDARTAINWADQGMGIALVPESIAKKYSQSKIVLVDHDNWESHLDLVWKKDRQVKPVIQKVIDLYK